MYQELHSHIYDVNIDKMYIFNTSSKLSAFLHFQDKNSRQFHAF